MNYRHWVNNQIKWKLILGAVSLAVAYLLKSLGVF
jgi:hypothetical protein